MALEKGPREIRRKVIEVVVKAAKKGGGGWVYRRPMFGRENVPVAKEKLRTFETEETTGGEEIYTVATKRPGQREEVVFSRRK